MAKLKILKHEAQQKSDAERGIDALLNLLKSGSIKSFNDLQSQLEPESEAINNLIKCLSILQNFDRATFHLIRRISPFPVEGKVDFKKLTANFQIEPVPRSSEVFHVRDDVRSKFLLEWKSRLEGSEKERFTLFFDKLMRHLKARGPRDELNLLSVLVLTDSAAAAEKFNELYARADAVFDLARCHEVICTLEDKIEIQSVELRELCKNKRQYLNARSFFENEYYQTVYYYERKQFVEPFDQLLNINSTGESSENSEHSKWIFHLYATGGMGKTMFNRWLIARHLVPEPRRIPVARLDFDFLHLPIIERFPWLLLLAIGAQLNGQIDKGLFIGLLNQHGEFLPLLRPPTEENSNSAARASLESGLQKITREDIPVMLEKHSSDLTESDFQKPFVVVLDTLEEMVLHHKSALIAVLRQLKKIRKYYRSMRLILTGRYNLLDELPEFQAEFENEYVVHELKLFSRAEASAYLTEKRNLQNEEIVNAIIEKCESAHQTGDNTGSNPFALSLFADLYEQEDVRTPQDIKSSPSVELAYLIRRVILRIHEPTIRWVMRYAVVPRNFTFEFLEKVVARHLRQQLSINEEEEKHEIPVDRPNEIKAGKAADFANQQIWTKPEKVGPLDLTVIWSDLKKYASSHGYISFEGAGQGAARLHPDVVVPMRLLLEDQPIFEPLHRTAAEYFEDLAAADPSAWERNIREAIYHRFHFDSQGAPDFWRAQFESIQAKKDPLVRLALAEELTSDDFTNKEGFPLLKSDKASLIDDRLLYEAHLRAVEAAISAIVTVDQVKVIELRTNIQKHLDYIHKLHEKGVTPSEEYRMPFDADLFHVLAESTRELKWNDEDLISLLSKAIKITTGEQVKLAIEVYLGDVLARNWKDKSLQHYKKALGLCRKMVYSQISMSEILSKIGLWYYRQNDYEQSHKIFLDALESASPETSKAARRSIVRYLADISLKLGQYDAAINFIERNITESGEKVYFEDALFRSQVQARALYEPLSALNGVKPYLDDPAAVDNAAAAKFYGDVYAMLMQVEQSKSEYNKSERLWNSELSFNGVERVRIARIKMQLLQVGNFNEAASLIDEWERKTTEIDLDIAFQIRLLSVLLNFQNGELETAANKIRDILNDPKLKRSPRSQIRALAAATAFNLGEKKILGKLVHKLETVHTPAARLPLLDVFQYADAPFVAEDEERRALIRLLEFDLTGQYFIPQAILLADVLRCSGETERAIELLGRAGRKALEVQNSFAYRQILLAKDRLGVYLADDDDLFASTFLSDYADYPVICAAGCLEQAERFFKQSDIPGCRESLTIAEEFLPHSRTITTRLEAKLNELFGEATRFEGNADAAITSFNLALAVYEKLGDKAAASRLHDILPTVRQLGFSETESFSVRLQKTYNSVSSELFYDQDLVEKGPGWSTLTDAVTAETQEEWKFLNFTKKFLENSSSVLSEFADLLFLRRVSEIAAESNLKAVDLKLDSLTPAFAKIPWEMALSESLMFESPIRCMYRSSSDDAGKIEKNKWLQIAIRQIDKPDMIVDGIFGPETKAALTNLKKRYHIDPVLAFDALQTRIIELLSEKQTPTKVLLIQPDRKQLIRSHNFQYQLSEEILGIYRQNYAFVRPLWANELSELNSVLKTFQPDIIHIQSSFNFMPNVGQILLDFGTDDFSNRAVYQTSKGYSMQLSPVLINDALALLPKSRLRPLVILDAVCPSGKTQTVHQLLYRNIFASELFQFGNAAGIIALGLSENSKLQYAITKELVDNLLNLKTFGETVENIRKRFPTNTLTEQISVNAIALFTNAPLLTVLPAGVEAT